MKVIVYDSIEKKNLADNREVVASSPQEALIQTLDVMDFYAKFNSNRKLFEDDKIPWIILKMTNKQTDANQ